MAVMMTKGRNAVSWLDKYCLKDTCVLLVQGDWIECWTV